MIVLIGHGFIGSAIARELTARDIVFRWCHHTDLWATLDPELIINAAGFTGVPNVDACESAKKQTIEGNILWPLDCERRSPGIPVLHIGSGCVYQGGPFTEEDPPNFEGSFYSLTRSLVQSRLPLDKSWLLRVRMPFSRLEHPKNLLTKLRRYPVLVEATNSLTCLEDLGCIVAHFIEHRPPFGVYNCTNPGNVRTSEIADMMGLTKQWFRDQADFEATVKAPRSNCILSTKKLLSVFPGIVNVRAALRCAIEQLAPDTTAAIVANAAAFTAKYMRA